MSDHRLLRARLHFDKWFIKRMYSVKHRQNKGIIDEAVFQNQIETEEWPTDPDLTRDYELFSSTIKRLAQNSMSPAVPPPERLSPRTKHALADRGQLLRDPSSEGWQKVVANWLARDSLRDDIKAHRERTLLKAIDAGSSLKQARMRLAEGREMPSALLDRNGELRSDKHGIEEIVHDFYSELYASKISIKAKTPRKTESPPPVLPSEVRTAISKLRGSSAAGPDGITPEMLKNGGHHLHILLAQKFSLYLEQKSFPDQWKESRMILIPKKGDKHDIGNYRPISLLSVVYKLFTRCIVSRLERTLDKAQPTTQAGFRSGYSCVDHIHTLRQIVEKSREYAQPLVLVFVDFKKAFDSVEHNSVYNSLVDQGVDGHYVETIEELNRGSYASVKPFERKVVIELKKGVRQGDTISPKLFAAVLESVMRRLNWDSKGIEIDGKNLTHLSFADDIVIISRSIAEAEEMLQELATESASVGLVINEKKTQFLRNMHCPPGDIRLGSNILEEKQSYLYLGVLFTNDGSIIEELRRRRRAAWAAFDKIKETVRLVRDPVTRANIFSVHVLPALCYGCECWPTSHSILEYMGNAYRGLERALVGLSRRKQRDRQLSSHDLRRISLVPDIAVHILKAKHRWAGHVMRRQDDRWTRRATEWTVRTDSRGKGRPPTRWSDYLDEFSIKPSTVRRTTNESRSSHSHFVHWSTVAQDRLKWKHNDPHSNNL